MRQLHNRRQKPGEKFDDLLHDIKALSNRLQNPLLDHELCEVVRGALREDIQKDLLYMKIYGLEHLRQLVREGEAFADRTKSRFDYERPRHVQGPNKYPRTLAAVELQTEKNERWENQELSQEMEQELAAFGSSPLKCWNCRQEGHPWFKCKEEPNLFCWSCGNQGVKTPDCVNCKSKNLRMGSLKGWGNARRIFRSGPICL
jgi:hypothetical protein